MDLSRENMSTLNVIEPDFREYVSELDGSINHQYPDGSEFRLVRRADHDTIYLSSHTGCALGCTMCWLTATGQTAMAPLTADAMLDRAGRFASAARGRVNLAFMARGDALANPNVNGSLVMRLLRRYTSAPHAKVTISTIFPKQADAIDELLFRRFKGFQPNLYWSLYTFDEAVRETLLPNAGDPYAVLEGLVEWQNVTGLEVVIHHALIDGVNSGIGHAEKIVATLADLGLCYRVNLVRYNPPDNSTREASDDVYETHRRIYAQSSCCAGARIQPRVGFDVSASCGMFLDSTVSTP